MKTQKKLFTSKIGLITIGLILVGISFFGFWGFARAEQLPADLPQATPPSIPGLKQPPAEAPLPADIPGGTLAFKQISLMVNDLNLDKANREYASEDLVKGSLNLKNDSNIYADGVYYKVTLHKQNSTNPNVLFLGPLTAIDYVQSEAMNFTPQEEKKLAFSYKIPKFYPSGDNYIIQISVFNARGFELISDFKEITVKNSSGEEKFVSLDLEESQVFGTDRPYNPQEGAVFEYDKEYNPATEENKIDKDVTRKNEIRGKIAYTVKNNPEEKAIAKVSFYKHGNYLKAIDAKSYEVANDFAKNASGFIDFKLPIFSEPGTYEAVVQLYSNEEKISNSLGIRYTTKGDSGLLYDFLIEKNGENNFTLNLMWTGAADFARRDNTKETPSQIIFQAKEKNTGRVCFEKTIDSDLRKGGTTQVPFTLNNCSAPYQFDAKLQKDGKILDQQQVSEPEKGVAKKSAGESKYSAKFLIFSGFGLLTLMLLLVVFLKKKSVNSAMMIIFAMIISLGFLFGFAGESKAFQYTNTNGDAYADTSNPYRFIYYHPTYGWSCSPATCPEGYGCSYLDEWNMSLYGSPNCPGSYGMMPQGKCCPMKPNYDEWGNNLGKIPVCGTGDEWTYIDWSVNPSPVECKYFVNGHWPAYDYILNNGTTTFNQGDNMQIHEIIHAYPNCGNGGGQGWGHSNYYIYNSEGTQVYSSGNIDAREFLGSSTTDIALNFAPGNYTLYISGTKTFYGGQDDPMYNGSINGISQSFTIAGCGDKICSGTETCATCPIDCICPVCTPGVFDPVSCRGCDGAGQWGVNCGDYGNSNGIRGTVLEWCSCELKCTGKNTNPACVAFPNLTVAKTGSGTGNVTSDPVGINCVNGEGDCSENYSTGTVVTLSAYSTGNSTFAGWSGGGCSGTGTCTVTMDIAKTITATYNVCTATYSCNINCSDSSNCGKDVYCLKSCEGSVVANSNCNGGAGCGGTGEKCPACPSPRDDNWKEVNP